MGARMYQPGELIKGTVYRVVRHVATGGMGSVFDVEDTTVGKRYMLKTLHPDLFGRNDLARRMEQEARILARLQHPNIVEVVTAGETQDELHLPYYVMERLNGQNLRTVLEKKGALDPIHAFRIGIDLLDALAHAHDNGVIHRDVKPENVFLHRNLNGTTTTKLLDFGIMRLLDTATKTDTMGRFVGTMRYASPEQVLTNPLTPMTDVYSAGLCIYEMLAGQGPFDDIRDLAEVGRAHIQSPPPPLSRFTQLPREVEMLVMSSLAKEPSQRPKDAFRYASELRRMLRDAESAPRAQQTQVSPLTASPSQVAPHVGYSPSGPTREPGPGLDSTQLPDTRVGPLHAPGPISAQAVTNVALPPTQAQGAHPPTLQMQPVPSLPATMQQPSVPMTVQQPGGPVGLTGDEATLLNLADAAAQAAARVGLAPTLASIGANPLAVGPTLASNVGPGYAGHVMGPGAPQSQVPIPSAAPPSPGTAMMPQPARPPVQPHAQGFDASHAPHTAQPATPLMRPRTPSVQPSPQAAPGASQGPQVTGPVDRNAETRGYQPPLAGRSPGTDTHRTDENGRSIAGGMDLVFPRGHGAMPQPSTGGASALSVPMSREPRGKAPAMLTGMLLAFVALVPTGFVMRRMMPPRAAASAVRSSDVAAPAQTALAPVSAPASVLATGSATGPASGPANASPGAGASVASVAQPAAAPTSPAVAALPQGRTSGPRAGGGSGKGKPADKPGEKPATEPGAKSGTQATPPTKPDGPGVDL